MAEPVLEGASLPEGFEVDETSAYFGVTESSDIVHQLMSMDKNQSIVAFFTMVSDVVLKPGEFDFEEASKVLNCEGGEIYFLVSGHLGLMSFADPILHYLGLPDSLGEESPNGKPDLEDAHFESLKRLSNPMNMLKVLAIAQSTVGPDEVMKYYLTLSELFNDVNSNHSVLIDIANEFDSALDVIGHPIPISHLANSIPDLSNLPTVPALDNAKSVSKDDDSAVEAVPIPTKETKPEPQTTKATVVKEAVSSPKSEPQESVPLPGKMVEDEPKIEHVAPPSAENNLTDRKAAKATDNAFEGAFGMMVQPEPSEASLSTQEIEPENKKRLF